MTELELQAEVGQLCDSLGLLWHHCADSTRCQGTPGLPDLIALGEGGLVLAELKDDRGNMTTNQHLWLRTAARADGELGVLSAKLWRPAEMRIKIAGMSAIQRELERLV